jgi:uncharacterized membrane protein
MRDFITCPDKSGWQLKDKYKPMKNYLFPVFATTGFLIVYLTALFTNLNTGIILFMFSISPVVMIWMVYRVLTADTDSSYTFEERWYEDQ